MQMQFFKSLIIILINCLIFETSYLSAQQRVKRKRSSRIKQSSSRPRRDKNPTIVVALRLKGPRYAKIPVYPLPDSTIDKLVTWHAGKYCDILNRNGKVTNQYKGDIYVKII
ncbi:hypothetical protein F8M41_014863 [Gigaspora margarita]|uniref:Uncharacterized protein n=1 Tax=Gigaspora margarita TaxID=4874 RepID=A0A8H4AR87_GIGMA|nr:hypothetical protein F8M41_014863 [Gigaspora margarita]